MRRGRGDFNGARCAWRTIIVAVVIAALASPAVAGAAARPQISGAVTDSGQMSGAISVAVAGHYAYTTAYFSGRLVAVDISHPGHPFIAGASAYSPALQNASTINLVGRYAYVVSKNRNASHTGNDDGSGNSLTILDIAADPAQPSIVGIVHDPVNLFGAYGVAASGQHAYVAAQGLLKGQPTQPDTSSGSFSVIDTSNPAAPAIVGTLANNALPAPWTGSNALQHASAVALSGHFAYITAPYSNRLTVIDVGHPAAPRIVASLSNPARLGFPVDVAIRGHDAFVVGSSSSAPALTVVDIAHPAAPRIVGTLSSPFLNGPYRIRVRGPFAYIASTSASTLSVIDISKPTAPQLLAGVYDGLVHLNSASGVDVNPTGALAIVSSPSLKTQSYGIYPPFPFQPGGPVVAGTITTIKLDPAALSVAIARGGRPRPRTSARSAVFRFAVSDVIAEVSCRLDRRPARSCTGLSKLRYSSLGRGRHTFTVLAVDPAGRTAKAQYSWVIR